MYGLTVTFVPDDHGDDRDSATPIINGIEITGNIDPDTDEDYFSIAVSGAGTLTATTTGDVDTVGHLYDSGGAELAANDDGDTGTNFDILYSITTAGTYYVRVASSSTGTGMYSLTVTFTPDHHGDDRDSATLVTSGMPVAGEINPAADQDYFSIAVSGTGTLTAATTGSADTVGTLYDSTGNELATDNDGGTGTNFDLSHGITAAGTYYVRVTGSGTSTGMYRLNVTFIPDDHGDDRDSATLVTSGMPFIGNIDPVADEDYFSIAVSGVGTLRAATTGSTDTVGTLYDSTGNELATDNDGGTGTNFDLSHRITAAGTYYIRVTGSGTGTGMYRLRVAFALDHHGNDRDSATLVTSGTAITGDINPGTDQDYFSIAVSGIGTLRATTTGSTDTVGTLYDSTGTQLATDNDGGTGTNFDLSHRITAAGTYYIRVTSSGTSTGMYRLSAQFIPDNHGNTQATATLVMSGTSVTGNIDPSTDEDYFSIAVSGAGTIRATTTGSADTVGTLYDITGNELATDDDSGTGTNFDLSYSVTAAGTYYIRVTSSGTSTGMYRLSAQFIPDNHGNTQATATLVTSGTAVTGNIDPITDEDYFSIVVSGAGTITAATTGSADTVGTLYDITGNELATDDDSGTGMNFDLSHNITAAGTYYIRVTGSGTNTGMYSLTATFIPDNHGNTRATATPVISGTAVAGNINPSTDEDYFSIVVSGAGTLTASTTGSTDTVGTLYDSTGTQLATDDDSGTGTNFDLSHNITASGTYYVRVEGTNTGMYSLTVTFTADNHGDTRASATPVTSGTAVAGNINPGSDQDYFSIVVSGAGTLTASTTGSTDTVGTLYDSTGTQLATDDDSGIGTNFMISHTITAVGTYYVRVTGEGSNTGMYSLAVTFAMDSGDDHGDTRAMATSVTSGTAVAGNIDPGSDEDYFSIAVSRAGTLTASTTGTTDTIGHLYGSTGTQLATNDNGGTGNNFDISYDVTAASTYYVRVTSSGTGTGMYSLTITFTPDHGNTRATATAVTSGTAVAGNINPGSDQDYFSIAVSRAGTIRATTTGTTDTIGHLYDSTGTELTTDDDDGAGRNFDLSHSVTAAGTYYVRVTSYSTRTGMYSLTVTFTESSADDHGNTRATATSVTSGTAVTGNIDPGNDEDYFSIALSGTGNFTATTTGTTDTIGHLYSSIGAQLSTNNDGGTGRNFRISGRINQAGTYYIRVTSSGSNTGMYSLTITLMPDHGDTRATATSVTSGTAVTGNIDPGNDEDYFSIVVAGAGTLTAATTGSTANTRGTLYDSSGTRLAFDLNSAGNNFMISHTITASGTYYVKVDTFGTSFSGSTGMYTLTVTFAMDSGDDHGDTRATATSVTSGTAVTGNIDPGNDEDYFSIVVSGTGTLTATTTGSTADTRGTLYDSSGTRLASDINSAGNNFMISHTITASGTYYVKVNTFGTSFSGSTGMYTLTITFAMISDNHGDTRATATSVTSGTAVAGQINPGSDEDYFSIAVSGAGTIKATTTGTIDTIGHLYDSDGTQLATDDDGGTGFNFDLSHSIAATGTYYVRVTSFDTRTGMYSLTVTFIPDHGDTRATATTVTSGTEVTGNINPGTDEDYFSIVAPGPGTLTATTTGELNTRGTLYDSDGTQLATDDDSGEDTNFDLSHSITAAGTYYVRVTSSGTATGSYSLTVTFAPDNHSNTRAGATSATSGTAVTGQINPGTDVDYFSIAVSGAGILTASTTGIADTIGTLYNSSGTQLATDDDSGTGRNFNVSHSIAAAGTYYVRVTSFGTDGFLSTGMYTLTVTFLTDHGNNRASATPVTSGAAVAGNINPGTDQDYFAIQVTRAGTLTATTTGTTDTIGTLYNSSGTQLATDDDSGEGMNFNISHSITAAGTYYVRVVSSGSTTGSYRLTVTMAVTLAELTYRGTCDIGFFSLCTDFYNVGGTELSAADDCGNESISPTTTACTGSEAGTCTYTDSNGNDARFVFFNTDADFIAAYEVLCITPPASSEDEEGGFGGTWTPATEK